MEKKRITHGYVHALLIWIYESVPGLGETYGNPIERTDVFLLSWQMYNLLVFGFRQMYNLMIFGL